MVIIDKLKHSRNFRLTILGFLAFLFSDVGMAAISVPFNIILFVNCVIVAIFFIIWFFIEADKSN
jgi:hypothetical protein